MPEYPCRNLRDRAVQYARNQGFNEDAIDAITGLIGCSSEDQKTVSEKMILARIALDSMIAAGFEMGYQAAVDDAQPARALGGAGEKRATKRGK